MYESTVASVLANQLAHVPVSVWRHVPSYDRVRFTDRLRVSELPAAARSVAEDGGDLHEAWALGVRLRDAIDSGEVAGWGSADLGPRAEEVLESCEAALGAVAAACLRCAAYGPEQIRETLEWMMQLGVINQVYEELGEILVGWANDDDAAGEALVRGLEPVALFGWHIDHGVVLGPNGARTALARARNEEPLNAAALVAVLTGASDDAAEALTGEDVSDVVFGDVLGAWIHGAWVDSSTSPVDDALCWHKPAECEHSECEHDTCSGWWHESAQSCEELGEHEELVETVWKLCAQQVQQAWARRGATDGLAVGDVQAQIDEAVVPSVVGALLAVNPSASVELLEACVKQAGDGELSLFERVPGAVVREALERVVGASGQRNARAVTKLLTEAAQAAWESMSDEEQTAFIREHWTRSIAWIHLLAEFEMRPAVLATARFDQIQALDRRGVLGPWLEAALDGVDLDALIAIGGANIDVSIEELVQAVKHAGGGSAP